MNSCASRSLSEREATFRPAQRLSTAKSTSACLSLASDGSRVPRLCFSSVLPSRARSSPGTRLRNQSMPVLGCFQGRDIARAIAHHPCAPLGRLQVTDFSQILLDQSLSGMMADREGFEPPIPLRVCRISSAVHSTTLPPVRGRLRSKRAGYYTRRSAKTSLRSRAGRILSRAVFAASHSAGFATLSLDLCDPSDYRASSGVGKPAPDLFWPLGFAPREPTAFKSEP